MCSGHTMAEGANFISQHQCLPELGHADRAGDMDTERSPALCDQSLSRRYGGHSQEGSGRGVLAPFRGEGVYTRGGGLGLSLMQM